MSFLDTLKADAENLVEADLPSAGDVRGILAALVKRVEQLVGIETTSAPPPPAPPSGTSAPVDSALAQQVRDQAAQIEALKQQLAAQTPPGPA